MKERKQYEIATHTRMVITLVIERKKRDKRIKEEGKNNKRKERKDCDLVEIKRMVIRLVLIIHMKVLVK